MCRTKRETWATWGGGLTRRNGGGYERPHVSHNRAPDSAKIGDRQAKPQAAIVKLLPVSARLHSTLAGRLALPASPCESALARWGTELHDRFMLPHYVEQDFRDVMEEMQQAGYPFKAEWFAPHFEFRFPKYGDFAVKGIEFELRHALEAGGAQDRQKEAMPMTQHDPTLAIAELRANVSVPFERAHAMPKSVYTDRKSVV